MHKRHCNLAVRSKKLLHADPIAVNRKSTLCSGGQGFHSQFLRFLIISLQSNITLEIILAPFSAETYKQDEENPCFRLEREESRTPLKHSELICRNRSIDSTRGLNSHLKHRFTQERPVKHPKLIKLTPLKKEFFPLQGRRLPLLRSALNAESYLQKYCPSKGIGTRSDPAVWSETAPLDHGPDCEKGENRRAGCKGSHQLPTCLLRAHSLRKKGQTISVVLERKLTTARELFLGNRMKKKHRISAQFLRWGQKKNKWLVHHAYKLPIISYSSYRLSFPQHVSQTLSHKASVNWRLIEKTQHIFLK